MEICERERKNKVRKPKTETKSVDEWTFNG